VDAEARVPDRCGPQQRPVARYIRRQFALLPGATTVNARHHFNKWHVHTRLNAYNELQPIMPETVLFHDMKDVERLLEKYGVVYLKSLEGSTGREVMRVARSPRSGGGSGDGGGIEYGYFRQRSVTGTVADLKCLKKVTRGFFGRKRFIVQQGIDVVTIDGNNADLRALMQRDGQGEWRLVSAPVRVATGHCAITSTRSGSTVYTLDSALANVFCYEDEKAAWLKAEIRRTAFLITGLIERKYGRFGELGIDLALDNRGKLWFIEVNAKPGKDTVLLAGNRAELRDAFRLPLDYCRYLAGFARSDLGAVPVVVR
jgi:hypothetical protein